MPDQETETRERALIAEGDEPGVRYTKSTQQLDLEDRIARENGETLPEDKGRDFSGGASEEDLDAFVGVDPVYRNFADERDRPRFAEDDDSAEAEFERRHTDASDMILVGLPEEYVEARNQLEGEVADHNERAARGEVNTVVENAPVTAVTAREARGPADGTGPSQADENQVAPERAEVTDQTDDEE